MYDNRLLADRNKLDAAVQKKLGKRGRTRGDITAALGDGATPRMVSSSLRRLLARKTAERIGPDHAPLYRLPQKTEDAS